MTTILIADDESLVREVLASYLGREGFNVVETGVGSNVVELVATHEPSLLILDVMLPGADGFTVLESLDGAVPVLMLTSRSQEPDRIRGLELGADDYVTKPFSPREVTMRVKNILRRTGAAPLSAGDAVIEAGDIVIDVAKRTATVGSRSLDLTVKEFDLLVFLTRSPSVVFSRADILREVWDSSPEWQDAATVTVHIRRLRTKIEEDTANPKRLLTVWGLGYRFEPWSG
ncbi:MAG: response regulator transcription factor [Acidimicrobiales bacterium]